MKTFKASAIALLLLLGAVNAANAAPCKTIAQRDCFRFDVLSLQQGEIPVDKSGQPNAPRALAAVAAGKVKVTTGNRTMVVYIWTDQVFNAADLATYVQPDLNKEPARTTFEEIVAARGPEFDKSTENRPTGIPRAFRFYITGAAASFQFPKAIVGLKTYMVFCPEWPSYDPDRLKSQEGLWVQPKFFNEKVRAGNYWHGWLRPFVTGPDT